MSTISAGVASSPPGLDLCYVTTAVGRCRPGRARDGRLAIDFLLNRIGINHEFFSVFLLELCLAMACALFACHFLVKYPGDLTVNGRWLQPATGGSALALVGMLIKQRFFITRTAHVCLVKRTLLKTWRRSDTTIPNAGAVELDERARIFTFQFVPLRRDGNMRHYSRHGR